MDERPGDERRGRGRRAWSGIVVGLILIAAIGGAAWLRSISRSRATPPPPLPSPNGYDDLLLAASRIVGEVPAGGNVRLASLDDLKTWVAGNRGIVESVRAGLAKASAVPVIYRADLTEAMERVTRLRQLARLLMAESEIADREGRPEVAARLCLDRARLGRAIGRRGLAIDAMVGYALQTSAINDLSRARPHLSQASLREAIAGLLAIDREPDDFTEVLAVEDYWFEQTTGSWFLLQVRLSGGFDQLRAPAVAAGQQSLRRVQAGRRAEIVALASQLFEVERGHPPDQPADLVPDYLATIPTDPATGRPIGAVP